MFVFLSKLLPIFVYPVGLTCFLTLLAFFWPQRPLWQRRLTGLAFLFLWLASSRWVSAALLRSLEWRYLPPEDLPTAEAIVIMGGGTKTAESPRPIVELSEAGDRMVYGAWLYHQGKGEHILLTGGTVFTDATSIEPPEAQDMLVIMRMLSVPEAAIWLETQSRNSYENALYSRPLLEKAGVHEILLVTSALHMPRSVALFQKQGFAVIPAPTDFLVTEQSWRLVIAPDFLAQLGNLLPTAENLQGTTWAMKEYIGLLIYRLQGWL